MTSFTNTKRDDKQQQKPDGRMGLEVKSSASCNPSNSIQAVEDYVVTDGGKVTRVPHCCSLPYLRRVRYTMNDMRLEGKYTDLVLVCGQRAFPCHRMLLVACSKFFDDLLRSDDPTTTVELEDVPENVMELMLSFVYTGQIEPPDSSSEVILHTLTTAQLLQLKGAPEMLCTSWLFQKPAHRIDLFLDWADEFSNDSVKRIVLDHVMNHLHEVLDGKEFDNFTSEQLHSLLSHPRLPVATESELIAASVVRWLNCDLIPRHMCLDQLLGLGLMADDLIAKIRSELSRQNEPEKLTTLTGVEMQSGKLTADAAEHPASGEPFLPDTQEDSRCKDHTESVIPQRQRSSPNRQSVSGERSVGLAKKGPKQLASSGESLISRQVSADISFHDALENHNGPALLVVSQAEDNCLMAHVFLPVAAVWAKPVKIPATFVQNQAMINVNGRLYFVGGEVQERKLPTLLTYDMKHERIIMGSPMCLPRSATRVVCIGTSLVVVGGIGRLKTPLTHVERYDIALDLWRVMPTLHQKRYDAGVVVVDESIYALGGCTSQCEVLTLGREDIGWQKIASLPESFEDIPVLAVVKGLHVNVFRASRPDKVWVLDTRQKGWNSLRVSGHLPHGLVDMFSHGEDFYALDNLGRLHMFDTKGSLWRNSITCPKTCLKSLHITFLNLDELHY